MALNEETSARISIYVEGENNEEPFKFKIGSGSQHLIVNILNDKVKYRFSTGRYWTRFKRGAASFFKSVLHYTGKALSAGSSLAIQWF